MIQCLYLMGLVLKKIPPCKIYLNKIHLYIFPTISNSTNLDGLFRADAPAVLWVTDWPFFSDGFSCFLLIRWLWKLSSVNYLHLKRSFSLSTTSRPSRNLSPWTGCPLTFISLSYYNLLSPPGAVGPGSLQAANRNSGRNLCRVKKTAGTDFKSFYRTSSDKSLFLPFMVNSLRGFICNVKCALDRGLCFWKSSYIQQTVNSRRYKWKIWKVKKSFFPPLFPENKITQLWKVFGFKERGERTPKCCLAQQSEGDSALTDRRQSG